MQRPTSGPNVATARSHPGTGYRSRFMTMVAFLALAFLALAVTACGAAEPSEGGTDVPTTEAGATSTTAAVDGAFPVTIDAPNGPVTVTSRPERIVSISPTSTEVLFAVGAGDQVVAVDGLSDHPDDAPTTELSAFTPSIEAIAAYDPDLVVLSFDPNQDIIPGLEALGVPVLLHPTAASLEDAYTQWEQIGAATGQVSGADALVADTRAALDSLYSSLPDGAADLTYYYELDDTYFTITSSTFIGEVLAPTGVTNIADTQDAEGFGYPQLTPEYIVGADPDLILLADTQCCGQSAVTVGERPGWDTMAAVRMGQIVELDDDVASRWGPRIVELVEDVVDVILAATSADA